MPPIVACALVETSTGYHRPCGFRYAFSWSSTTPGCTATVRASLSNATTWFRCLRVIDDERGADGLPALRGAAAARQHRHALLDRDAERGERVFLGLRHHHADRLDLVDRRVGRIAPARGGVEQHLAPDLAPQAGREGGITGRMARGMDG